MFATLSLDFCKGYVLFRSVNQASNNKNELVSITKSLRCLDVIASVENNEEATKLLTLIQGLKMSKRKLHLMISKVNMSSLQQGIWAIDNMNYEVTICKPYYMISKFMRMFF